MFDEEYQRNPIDDITYRLNEWYRDYGRDADTASRELHSILRDVLKLLAKHQAVFNAIHQASQGKVEDEG